jgi:hypothetical protein
MDLNEEIYSYFLNLIACIVSFTNKSHYNVLIGGFSKIIAKVSKKKSFENKVSDVLKTSNDENLRRAYVTAISTIVQKVHNR